MSKFHSHSGWHWERAEDGSVNIYNGDVLVHSESADSWASIVSSVSAGGEMDNRFYTAKDFHFSTGSVAVKTLSQPAGYRSPY